MPVDTPIRSVVDCGTGRLADTSAPIRGPVDVGSWVVSDYRKCRSILPHGHCVPWPPAIVPGHRCQCTKAGDADSKPAWQGSIPWVPEIQSSEGSGM